MKVVELALKAGRKRQSEITRFVHHYAELSEKSAEAIPTYENFCFALTLFRSRIAENVLEAKALLEKLLAFQVNGEFPVYLHEYPVCRYAGLGSKLYPIIFFILRDFDMILGDHLREELHELQNRYALTEIDSPETPEECAEFLLHCQITGKDRFPALKSWDAKSLAYAGFNQKQERGEPALTLYDLFLGEWSGQFSARALQDHAVHLRGSLIYPAEMPQFTSQPPSSTRYLWGSGNPTHSMVLNTQGIISGEKELLIVLPEKEVQEEMEIVYFYNLHADTHLLINGQKATSFQLGDKVELISKGFRIELIFTLEHGEGQFWGHLYRGNRPGQLCCKGEEKHEAFDGAIGLRTVKRGPHASIRILFR
jgi:hypothetical protein